MDTPPSPPPKRKERPETDPLDSPNPAGQLPKRLKLSLAIAEKLDKLFDAIHDLDWTLGDFLHHVFTHQDEDKTHIPRSQRHGNIVQRYISGNTTHGVGQIIESWLTSPDGRRGVDEADLFDIETPYREIKPVRVALTAFAAQACSDFIGRESRAATDKSGGLHAHISAEDGVDEMEWSDLGDAIRAARESLQSIQQLAFHFLKIIAEPTPRSRKGVITVRKSRPRDNVSCFNHAICIS
jgi:hypothetical protein